MKTHGRQFAAAWILVLLLLTIIPEAAYAGFVRTDAGVKYTNAAGSYITGFRKIGKKYYLFSESGILLTGVQKVGSRYYFFKTTTGVLQYGWIKYLGKKYYANKKTGVLAVNKKIGKYYFGADGALVQKAASSSLNQKTGWYKKGKKTYYYKADHTLASGLQVIDSGLYYFNSKGVLQKKKIVRAGGALYYAGKNGVIVTSRLVKVGKRYYYAQTSGAFATGLIQIGSSSYYFKANGVMARSVFVTWNGQKYYARSNGKIAKNRWVKSSGKYYYAGSDGAISVNRYIGGYYLGLDGARVAAKRPSSGFVVRSGKTYYYDTEGMPAVSQWVKSSDGKRYYMGADGAAVTGIQIVGGYKYYFNDKGVLQTDSVLFVSGYCYYTDPGDGHIVSESTNTGVAIVDYAKQFVGNPYVYGGTSLTKGADCSGFTQAVFLHFGVRIMRVAVDQLRGASGNYLTQGYAAGIQVADSNLQPGDLVFYGSGNYASHVAIYIGSGKVVHAANSRLGIIVSSIDYVKNRLNNKNRRYWS